MRDEKTSWFVFVGLLFGCLTCISAYDWDVVTDLDLYVQSDDGFFSWQEITSYAYEGVTVHILNMTSQQYQDDTFSSRSVWWHYVGIAVPDQIDYLDFGVLWIGGGSNDDPVPASDDVSNAFATSLANDTKVIVGYILQMPNQPIVFASDPKQLERRENEVIAWTWRSYLDTEPPDNTVLARMPMTKAAKRGLDTIHAYALENVPGANIQRFGVAGPSEGGWTVWSIAATDQRVVAIYPLVFSLLNAQPTLMEHFQKMDGAWSFALQAFYNENITQEFFNPKTEGIYDVEDMYRYRERLTIPIVEVLASGDEIFLCDDTVNWWNDIPSPNKYITMLPNSGHIMAPHYQDIYENAVSVLLTFLQGLPYPSVTWEMSQTATGGEILFHTNPAPNVVRAYSAVTLGNDTRRDFRFLSGTPPDINTHPVYWRQNIPVEDLGGGNYRVAVEQVVDEWVGFFVEGEWTGPSGLRMFLTSEVNIVPNAVFPHEPCTDAASCYGTLV